MAIAVFFEDHLYFLNPCRPFCTREEAHRNGPEFDGPDLYTPKRT